jgi:hypothetical protein
MSATCRLAALFPARFPARAAVVVAALSLSGCATVRHRPSVAPGHSPDAVLVLPGFGYGSAGARTFDALRPALAGEGIDLYVADYLTRGGLASSRKKLEQFMRINRLDQYERLHVFAFLAGAWTVNPLLERQMPPNLTSVVYDRSPFQERAPAIAVDKLRVLAWLRFGSTIFDIARTPYPSLDAAHVHVALIVESRPTSFIKGHAKAALAYGPFAFACADLHQPYDDCGFLPLNHDELYMKFGDVWPELRAFIRTGRFTSAMNRTPPAGDALVREAR